MPLIRVMDRLTEPENPLFLRFLLVCAALLYAAGVVWDPSYFAASIGCVMFAWPMAEDRAKLKRERRLAQWRAQMDEFERLAWNYARLPARMRQIYGPIADCEGMGI